MINKTKTVYLLRQQLRELFLQLEYLQEAKIKSPDPQTYIVLDNRISQIKLDIDTMKELIVFLDAKPITKLHGIGTLTFTEDPNIIDPDPII
jgi:hypothetical protein